MGGIEEKTPDHMQAELGLSSMCQIQGSNPQLRDEPSINSLHSG